MILCFKIPTNQVLTVDCPENVTVQADHDLLRIALTNYLTNAAKYGATHTQVRLTVREEQGIITTIVWNEGVGFRPEEQALLFTKFSRLDNENTFKNRFISTFFPVVLNDLCR